MSLFKLQEGFYSKIISSRSGRHHQWTLKFSAQRAEDTSFLRLFYPRRLFQPLLYQKTFLFERTIVRTERRAIKLLKCSKAAARYQQTTLQGAAHNKTLSLLQRLPRNVAVLPICGKQFSISHIYRRRY